MTDHAMAGISGSGTAHDILKKQASFGRYMRQHFWLYVLILPGLLYFIIFKYIPMAGLVIAFQNYSPFLGISGSEWVGLVHFRNFFTGDDFGLLLGNTLGIAVLNLVFYFPAPIFLALLLNEIKNQGYKRTIQTLIYVPHFISFVIVASLTYTLFNTSDGLINQILLQLTGRTVDFLSLPQYFKGLIVGQNIWKETGYGMIIFLAALSGVDMEQYEAARVDGAGRWRQMWYITLPSIKGTIIIMLILRVGTIMNTGFEQIFLMQNALNRNAGEVFDTYVYRMGITQGAFSSSTAVGMFKAIVGTALVLTTNWIAKKNGESGIY